MRNSKLTILVCSAFMLAAAAGTVRMRTVKAQDATLHYKRVDNWAHLPDGEKFGVMSGVDVDSNGDVYTLQRDDAATKTQSKVMVFDANGKFLRSWGEGAYESAHGLRVFPDHTIWVTDRKMQQAFHYDKNGKLLMTLGEKDVTGDDTSEDHYNGISEVVQGKNGDLFISDGEGANSRVVKRTKDGKFIKFWGGKGTDPGQFRLPHDIAIDSKGRVWVADRTNKRVQIFDQDGKFLDQMTQFGQASALAIVNDIVYVTTFPPVNTVIVGTTDGKILATFEGIQNGHSIAADSKGNIYVAESVGDTVSKWEKQ